MRNCWAVHSAVGWSAVPAEVPCRLISGARASYIDPHTGSDRAPCDTSAAFGSLPQFVASKGNGIPVDDCASPLPSSLAPVPSVQCRQITAAYLQALGGSLTSAAH